MLTEIVNIDGFYIHDLGPKDFFENKTLSIEEWMQKDEPNRIEKWEKLIKVIVSLSKHKYWENNLRNAPRIGYDIVTDSDYFVFKINNNGITFIIAEREMKELE